MYTTPIRGSSTKTRPESTRVVFEWHEVEALYFDDFLAQFSEDALPKGEELASMMDQYVFFPDAYNHDPREIYAVKEVRTFYQTLFRKWPYWFFFCDLRFNELIKMTACCMKKRACVNHEEWPATPMRVRKAEVSQFIKAGLAPMDKMFERARMPKSASLVRAAEILRYYDLYSK